MNNRPSALDTYLERIFGIQRKLARLQQLADDHFDDDPEAINWTNVGELERVEAALDNLLSIVDRRAD